MLLKLLGWSSPPITQPKQLGPQLWWSTSPPSRSYLKPCLSVCSISSCLSIMTWISWQYIRFNNPKSKFIFLFPHHHEFLLISVPLFSIHFFKRECSSTGPSSASSKSCQLWQEAISSVSPLCLATICYPCSGQHVPPNPEYYNTARLVILHSRPDLENWSPQTSSVICWLLNCPQAKTHSFIDDWK